MVDEQANWKKSAILRGFYLNLSIITLSIFVLMSQFVLPNEVFGAEEPQNEVVFTWRSTNIVQEQLSKELEILYQTLYNTNNMRVKEFKDLRGETIERILRNNNLFFGPFFPSGIDSVLCDLNSSSCSRELSKIDLDYLKNPTKHVGGYRKTKGKWTNKKGDKLIIPRIDFQKFTDLAYVNVSEIKSDYAISSLKRVKQEKIDCSGWKHSCNDLYRKLNPQVSSSDDEPWRRDFVVPVTRYQTDISFRPHVESVLFKKISELLSKSKLLQTKILLEREWIFTPVPNRETDEWKQLLMENDYTDMAIDFLSNNLVPFGEVQPQLFEDEPQFNQQSELFALIGHPLNDSFDIPDELRHQVRIGVLDSWVDRDHCDFGSNIHVIECGNGVNITRSASCNKIQDRCLEIDHGTHVVGLIASELNQKLTAGLNPFATVVFNEIDYDQAVQSKYRSKIAKKFQNMYFDNQVDLFNLSWRYFNRTGDNDPIKRTISALSNNTLFVVAAGNDAAHFSLGECPVYPACFTDSPNVITVIGIDRNENRPNLWRSSHTNEGSNSSDRFHIAAVADRVLSTASGDSSGYMSGTSQAVPQVSVAASYVISAHKHLYSSQNRNLYPVRLKNRIIYTADIFPELLNHVQSGRLNIQRAVDIARDYFEVKVKVKEGEKKEGNKRVIIGQVTKFGVPEPEEIFFECQDGRYYLNKKKLLRMYLDKSTNRYVLFTTDNYGQRDAPIQRHLDCRLKSTSKKVSLDTGSEEIVIQFKNVTNYISAMY